MIKGLKRGKRRINLTVSADWTVAYVAYTEAGSPTEPVDVYLTVQSGFVLQRGLVIASFHADSRFYLDNQGTIAGDGGQGAYGAGASLMSQSFTPGGTGATGGDAITSTLPIQITNASGFIFGGGGGGGSGGSMLTPSGGPYNYSVGGGGGGGGRGYYSIGGAGGITDIVFTDGFAGAAGTSSGGGAGGLGGDSSNGGDGGAGGDWASSGAFGGDPSGLDSSGTGAGGFGGYSVRTNGKGITWISGNDGIHVKGSQN